MFYRCIGQLLNLQSVQYLICAYICYNLTDTELKGLCQEVMDLLKSVVGVEVFSTHYATCQKTVMEKREGRKHKIAVEVGFSTGIGNHPNYLGLSVKFLCCIIRYRGL